MKKKILQPFYLKYHDMTTYSLDKVLGNVNIQINDTHEFGNSSGDV